MDLRHSFDGLLGKYGRDCFRQLTIEGISEFINGDQAGLDRIPSHSCSMLNYSAHDKDLVNRFLALSAVGKERKKLSVDASLMIQMNDYKGAMGLYSNARSLDPMEAFLNYKCYSFYRKTPKSNIVPAVNFLCENFGWHDEILFDLALNELYANGEESFYKRLSNFGFNDLIISAAKHAISQGRTFFNKPTVLAKQHFTESHYDWAQNVIAVFGLRCSGGSAVQDWLDDFSCVMSSAGEYVATSGIHGINNLFDILNGKKRLGRNEHPLLDFIRIHCLGLTVPVNRSYERVLRQPRADKKEGVYYKNIEVLVESLQRNDNLPDFIVEWSASTWNNYVQSGGRQFLLLRKLFSGGRLENLKYLPSVKCILVWRDPRDQYLDQCERGYCRWGDVKGFIRDYREKISSLITGINVEHLKDCGKFFDVSFELFVRDRSYRDLLAHVFDIDLSYYSKKKFAPEVSSNNIGRWVEYGNQEEMDYIAKHLAKIISFCNGTGEMDLMGVLNDG